MTGDGRAAGVPEATASLADRYDAGRPGPTLIVLTAVHGNEPAGAQAARRVLRALCERSAPLCGTIETWICNPYALARGVRFIAHDLNRAWTPDRIERLRAGAGARRLEHEDAAQLALLRMFDRIRAHSPGEIVCVDLHSTSAPSAPFTCISDTLRSRSLARALPIPLLLGIEESIRGSTLDFLETAGHPGVVVEGGQHTDPATADRLEAALWLLIVAASMLDARDAPDHAGLWRLLREAARGTPRVVEVVYRHQITDADGFTMLPGFRNFDRVRRGQLLARERAGEVRAPARGRLTMPRYQDLGDDGFFLVRRVHPRWLDASTAARRLRLDRLLIRLPGVQRHPTDAGAVLVDARIARWWVVEAFHLAGYRRIEAEGRYLTFRRRVE